MSSSGAVAAFGQRGDASPLPPVCPWLEPGVGSYRTLWGSFSLHILKRILWCSGRSEAGRRGPRRVRSLPLASEGMQVSFHLFVCV